MSTISMTVREKIFERLRTGAVPDVGLDAFAVGIDDVMREMNRQFELVTREAGGAKFLRGDYGCGKTFVSRLTVLRAMEYRSADPKSLGFVTSVVVVSPNDTRFHRFDEVYRKIVANLATPMCPRGALGDILDRWVGGIEEELMSGGLDPAAIDFDERVAARIGEKLDALTRGKAPEDFVRVLRAWFRLRQAGNFDDAGALLSWLAGSTHVPASATRAAGIKGHITSAVALNYLRGIVEIIRTAGHVGLVVVVDELETILRARRDVRALTMNGLRQLVDAAPDFPRLLWVFTGTPEFFDSQRGVRGLAPLDERIRFQAPGGFASLKQPQVQLRPFDRQRLIDVALKLRELYPSEYRTRLESVLDTPTIGRIVDAVSGALGGDVGIVPRQFLREFVGVMDRIDEFPAYNVAETYSFDVGAAELAPEDRVRLDGPQTLPDDDGGAYELVDLSKVADA
jgi:hypothetical protein